MSEERVHTVHGAPRSAQPAQRLAPTAFGRTPLSDRLTAIANRAAFGAAGLVTPPRLSILIFHRVLPEPDPLFPEEMDVARFDRLARLAARSFHVMTLGRALAHWREGRQLPRRSLVLTFDDGYADNAELALPVMKRHGIAGTFFVSTGFLDGGRMWNDTVIESIRATPAQDVDLSDLGMGLGAFPLRTFVERRALIDVLLPLIMYMDMAGRECALERLVAALGRPSMPDRLMMSAAQVRTLHVSGMEIGAHTRRHPILKMLPLEEAREEIIVGRDTLAALIQAPVDVMAYPNGRPGRDYDQSHVDMVRRAGFHGAVSTAPGAARLGDDVFQLPRFSPWDRSLAAWSARLWLNLWRGGFDVA